MNDSPDEKLKENILALKHERNAIILAHLYQRPEVQDIADHVEDSLGLSRIAASTTADTIVFCGVHFMAETASLLNPKKAVLLPDPDAGCPMADMITVEKLRAFKEEHPGAPVVCYINSSAEVKALSDICCTSSNAADIVESLENEELLFIPDQSLGAWVASKTRKKIHLYPGYCLTHHRLFPEDIEKMKTLHPRAAVMGHPECTGEVLRLCDFVGSTSAMLKYAATSPHDEFLVGTESGILHRLRKDNPGRQFHLLSDRLICPNMKLITLEKILWALRAMEPRITVREEVREKALSTIKKMLNAKR
ncbi:MAG: quinolinate synthase NadA [Candidatus Eremiobacteraeota bacterium]|nr:quinolinate synthase NadA [Candidatus Eremiobacteraeota bacterium]